MLVAVQVSCWWMVTPLLRYGWTLLKLWLWFPVLRHHYNANFWLQARVWAWLCPVHRLAQRSWNWVGTIVQFAFGGPCTVLARFSFSLTLCKWISYRDGQIRCGNSGSFLWMVNASRSWDFCGRRWFNYRHHQFMQVKLCWRFSQKLLGPMYVIAS